ncbi:hypothetical protein PPERSA_08637 [Pseudocohnilembus persalinus]|uniref:t-SNARE coiled-coil homology domain-containing protein n=1 Tax=Pseudocohnilembus persalinus TaxID=266149 RepID=A0A0V0R5W2_PSEPJ|nr:hypothetical protein PPERSA_08637 [Pseudocohnilembus persalinus]|eukprot:KRX09605.1 hypothetical protein PPERSA_08637 [Pseudocohnilembus persalinus]
MEIINKYKGEASKKKMNSNELAEITDKLCDILEKLELSQNQDINIAFNRSEALLQCYELQKILQNQFLGRKFARVSKQNLQFLNQIKKRIENQENILLQDGQNYLVEANLEKLKAIYKAIKYEEYFDENDLQELQKQEQKLIQNIKISIDYCKDKKIKQKAKQYVNIVENKESFNEIENEQKNGKDKQKLELQLKQHINYINSQISYENSEDDEMEEQKIQVKESENENQQEKEFHEEKKESSQLNEKQVELEQQLQELQQLKDSKLDAELLQERQEAINKIAYEIELLNEMQNEINNMVVQGGENIEKFNEELEGVLETTKQTNIEIKQAYKIQQQLRRKKIRAFFIGIGGALGFGLGGGIGTAIGTAGGAYLGKGIGKLLTKGDDDENDYSDDDKKKEKEKEKQIQEQQQNQKQLQEEEGETQGREGGENGQEEKKIESKKIQF